MAARSLGTLTLDLVAKIFGFRQGMDQAARIAEQRSRQISKAMSGVKKTIGGLFAGISAGFIVREIVHHTAEAEKVVAQLQAAVEATGGAAGFSADEMVGFAKELQRVTTFSDEAVAGMEGLLATFTKIKGGQFRESLTAVIDVATRRGLDLETVALALGKALEDPIAGLTRLSRIGIQFDASEKKNIKTMVELNNVAGAQDLILAKIESRYKGSAAAARNTLGGALTSLTNAYHDLFEASEGAGDEAVKSIEGLTKTLQDPAVIAGVQNLTSAIVKLLGHLGQAIAGLNVLFSRHGGDANTNLDLQIDATKQSLDAMLSSLGLLNKTRAEQDAALTKLPGGLTNNPLAKQVADLREEYDKLIAKQKVALGLITPTQRDVGGVRGWATAIKDAAGATQDATEEYTKQSEALEKQIALMGKTGKAAELRYDIEHGLLENMLPAEREALLAQAQRFDAATAQLKVEKDLAEAVAAGYDQIALSAGTAYDYMGRVRDTYSRTAPSPARAAVDAGMLDQPLIGGDIKADIEGLDNLNEAVQNVGDSTIDLKGDFLDTTDVISEESLQAARNFESAFAEFLFDPFQEGLDGMLRGFIDILRRMVAEIAASQILDALGGTQGISGWLGSLFNIGGAALAGAGGGGGFSRGAATGGTFSRGDTAIVGELGPERVLFGNDARVIPNDEAFGGITINNYMDNRGASQDLIRALPKILDERDRRLIAGLREARSRGQK